MSLSEGIKNIMFSAGDEENVFRSSVEFMDTLTRLYIKNLSIRMSKIADIKGVLDKECILFLFRNDYLRKKRITEIINSDKKITSFLYKGKYKPKKVESKNVSDGDILNVQSTPIPNELKRKKMEPPSSVGIFCNNGDTIYGHFDNDIPIDKLDSIQMRRYKMRISCKLDNSIIYDIVLDNVVSSLIREVENGFGNGSIPEIVIDIIHMLSKMFICDIVEHCKKHRFIDGPLTVSELKKTSEELKGFLFK